MAVVALQFLAAQVLVLRGALCVLVAVAVGALQTPHLARAVLAALVGLRLEAVEAAALVTLLVARVGLVVLVTPASPLGKEYEHALRNH